MSKRILSLFRNLFRKRAIEQALDDELLSSLEALTQEKMKQGLSQSVARREALMEIGGIEQVKEEVRAVGAGRSVERLARDCRYGLRQLRRNPGFAAVAVFTLALGIGANTAIFSVVNGVLISQLPFRNADRIVSVFEDMPDFAQGSISYPVFLDWQRDNRSFESMAAYRWANGTITGAGQPESVRARCVSPAFFPILGVNPILGRNFNADDDRRGADPTVLISAGLWQRKFGSDPNVIGKRLVVGGTGRTIVGVIPASFRLKI